MKAYNDDPTSFSLNIKVKRCMINYGVENYSHLDTYCAASGSPHCSLTLSINSVKDFYNQECSSDAINVHVVRHTFSALQIRCIACKMTKMTSVSHVNWELAFFQHCSNTMIGIMSSFSHFLSWFLFT